MKLYENFSIEDEIGNKSKKILKPSIEEMQHIIKILEEQ